MKIIEVSFHLGPGGAEHFVVDLANALAEHHDVTLLILQDDSVCPSFRQFYRDEVSEKVHYHCLGLRNGLTPSMWLKISSYIRQSSPDVVHYHGDRMVYWMIVPMLLASRSIKFYQTIHSDIHNGYDTAIYKCLVSLLGNCGRVRFVAISETNYRQLITEYPKVTAYCINNGRKRLEPTANFDDAAKEMSRWRKTANTKIFLHVARCHVVKNQNLLFTAFNAIVQKGYDAQLVVIGDGFDSELGKQLQAIASDSVRFIGAKKNVTDYMLQSDAFCLSSNYEGMPISVLEALLCGVPVVSTPVCGVVDCIRNGENGIIAEGFKIKDYQKALIQMYEHLSDYQMTAKAEAENSPHLISQCAKKYELFFMR